MDQRILTIGEIRAAVAPVARAYGVKKLTLFGSYARGEATAYSDIDLRIVDKGAIWGLFQLAGFHRELEERLDKPVDVLPTGALDEEFLQRIRGEEVVIFDADQ